MNQFNKYFGLLFLIIGGITGFLLLVAILVFLLKYISVGLFSTRFSLVVYHFFISALPYFIFLSAYYFLKTKIKESINKVSKILSVCFLLFGTLIAGSFLVVVFGSVFIKIKSWNYFLDDYGGYALTVLLVIVFLSSMILAFGQPKEKDWMEKHLNNPVE